MSMEQAILEHAGALKELAAAIRSMGVHNGDLLVQGNIAASGDVITGALLQDKAAELAAAGKQQVEAARQAQEQDAADNKRAADAAAADKTVEVVAAVSAEIEAKGSVMSDAEIVTLDYAKDVRPVLLAAIKKAGKDTVATMLKTFGVEKADQLKVEQLPAVLGKAQALAA